jgi:hypothetical protein
MQARYIDKNEVTPQLRALITDTLCTCFDDVSDIKRVAREKLGDDVYDDINWDDGKKWVYNNLVLRCATKGKIGLLLESAMQLEPSNWLLEQLTWKLVRQGYLSDTSLIPRAPASSET